MANASLEETLYIKHKNDQTELSDLLQGYKKDTLLTLADTHAVSVRKSWKKEKIVTSLSETILEQAETIYHPILKEILLRLPDLQTNFYRVKNLNDIKGFITLIQKGFFFVSKEKDGLLLIIPEEIIFSVQDRLRLDKKSKSHKKATHPTQESKKHSLLKHWKNNLSTIYGNVPLKHMQKTWNRYFENKVTLDEIKAILEQD